MNITQHIPDHIKRVSRAIGYALWLNTDDEWFGLPVILRARLDARQRAALAFMALKSLDRADLEQVANAALDVTSNQPIAPLFHHMDEAAFWADMAEPEALDAYCLASFNAMASPRKADFLEFVQGRAVA